MAQQLILAARKQYNTMTTIGSWDKVDPCDAQFAAMATQIQQLQAAQAAHFTSETGNQGGDTNGNGNKKFQVENWMIKKKDDQIWWQGCPWWWCNEHNDGKGVYVCHPPSDHSKWKKCKEERKSYICPRIDKPATAITAGLPAEQPAQQLEIPSAS